MTSRAEWTPIGFEDYFDAWAAQANPSDELSSVIMAWIATRDADPRQGATWDPQSDLWFAWIPGTEDMCGNKMACSYRIDHRARTVTCKFFGSLRYP